MPDYLAPSYWEEAMSYPTYRDLIVQLLSEGKTTGEDHSESLVMYTELNGQRMKKWDKIAQVSDKLRDKLAQIEGKQCWLVLTEAWCGDAAQNVPFLNKMCEASDKLEMRLLLRDGYLDLMDKYLTNGGRAIPKLIVMRAKDFKVLATWGPRPQPAMSMLGEYKADPEMSYEDFSTKLHAWYAKDRHKALQAEMYSLLDSTIG